MLVLTLPQFANNRPDESSKRLSLQLNYITLWLVRSLKIRKNLEM